MNGKKRPTSVTILAAVYILVGAVGVVYHFSDLGAWSAFRYDGLWIELTELLAILCGVFMLRGQNWARWLAVAWIALHVVLSVLEAFRGFAVHLVLCALIAWLLFRREAGRYFQAKLWPA